MDFFSPQRLVGPWGVETEGRMTTTYIDKIAFLFGLLNCLLSKE